MKEPEIVRLMNLDMQRRKEKLPEKLEKNIKIFGMQINVNVMQMILSIEKNKNRSKEIFGQIAQNIVEDLERRI